MNLLIGTATVETGREFVGPATMALNATIVFFSALALVAVNDYLLRRLSPGASWKRAGVLIGANLLLIFALSSLGFRLHTTLFEVNFEELLRRSYRIRLFFIGVLALLYVRFLHYRHRSKRAEVDNLRLRKREVADQLAGLQRKLDPHFLFNTLNTISGAIRQDKKEAGLHMLEDLADCYRYVLRTSDASLVSIGEEVDFIAVYARLLGHRFGGNFALLLNIPPHLRPRQIPPLTLQLLLENAVKHNQLTRNQPLEVIVEALEDDRLRVSNHLLPKISPSGGGEGLSNLAERYLLLGGAAARPVVTSKDNQFSVILSTFPHARLNS